MPLENYPKETPVAAVPVPEKKPKELFDFGTRFLQDEPEFQPDEGKGFGACSSGT